MTAQRRPKGTGTIRATREGKFRALFAFAPGVREELDGSPFATYKDAEAALDGLLAELHDAGAVRGLTLRKLGATVLDLREKEGYRSVTSERYRWRRYIETWELVDVPVNSITRADVRSWLAGLTGLAAQTRRNCLNLLRCVFAAALEGEHVTVNPCRDVKVKAPGTTVETSTHLTLAEAARLYGAALADDELTAQGIALAVFTGLRQGELRALLWSDVKKNHIIVRYGAPGRPTKNGKIRRVPLLPQARAVLDALPRAHPMVLPTPRGYHRPKGRIVDHKLWTAWCTAAGIKRRVRWHDLRHTCATLLLTGAMGGRPWAYEEVKEMLGHSSVKVTERYAAATGTRADQAVAAMHKGGDRSGASVLVAPPSTVQPVESIDGTDGRRGWDSNPRMTVLQTVA